MKHLDAERNEVRLGNHVVVWDNYFKGMYRCEVIGFTPQKVKIKALNPKTTYISTLKFPVDLLIIK